MTIRYTVNQLDNITGQFPEAQERKIAENELVSWSEFFAATIYDDEIDRHFPIAVEAVVSDDPIAGCWIGIAWGGDFTFADLELVCNSETDRREQVGAAIETYLNDSAAFEAAQTPARSVPGGRHHVRRSIMGKQGPPVSFRSATLEPELRSRGDKPGQTAARDLGRYYVLINQARQTVHERFADPQEWALLRDAIASAPGIDYQPHLLAISVADAIQLDRADQRYGIDGADLLTRLQSLSPLETVALLDTLERWWVIQERNDRPLK